MALEVIGAGFGRTGTLSLKFALEKLGFSPCYHMVEVLRNPAFSELWEAKIRGEEVGWDEIYTGYRAAVDWPTASFYRELADYYRDAKIILTVRTPERWYDSARNTIFAPRTQEGKADDGPQKKDEDGPPAGSAMMGRIMAHFGGSVEDRDKTIAAFNRHVAEVRRTIAPERLLVYEVREGWAPLCVFLGVPVPDEPFPNVNSTEEFQERVKEGREGLKKLGQAI